MKRLLSILLVSTLFVPCHAADSLKERATKQLKKEYDLFWRNVATVNKLARRREALTPEERKDLKSSGKRALVSVGIIAALLVGGYGIGRWMRTAPAVPPAPPVSPLIQREFQPAGTLAEQLEARRQAGLRKREVPAVQPEILPAVEQTGVPLDVSASALGASRIPAPVGPALPVTESSISNIPAPIVEQPVISVAPPSILEGPPAPPPPLPWRPEVGAPPMPPRPSAQPRVVPAQDPGTELQAAIAASQQRRQGQAAQQPGSIRITPLKFKLKAPQAPQVQQQAPPRDIAQALKEQVARKTPAPQTTTIPQEEEGEGDWEVVLTQSEEQGLAQAREQSKALEQQRQAQALQAAAKKETKQTQQSQEKAEPSVTTSVLDWLKTNVLGIAPAMQGSSLGESTSGSSLGESHNGE